MHKQEGEGPRQELQGAGRDLTRLVVRPSQGLVAPSYQVPKTTPRVLRVCSMHASAFPRFDGAVATRGKLVLGASHDYHLAFAWSRCSWLASHTSHFPSPAVGMAFERVVNARRWLDRSAVLYPRFQLSGGGKPRGDRRTRSGLCAMHMQLALLHLGLRL